MGSMLFFEDYTMGSSDFLHALINLHRSHALINFDRSLKAIHGHMGEGIKTLVRAPLNSFSPSVKVLMTSLEHFNQLSSV